MKNTKTLRNYRITIFVLLGIIAALLFLKGRQGKSEQTSVVFPETSGKFETVTKPLPLPIHDTVPVHDTIKVAERNPVNQELYDLYMEAADSLKKVKYVEAITENDYEIPLENDKLKTINKLRTRGQLLSFSQEFTIKQQEVQVPNKQTVLRVMVGADAGMTKSLDHFTAGARVMFQNRKGDVFSGSVNTDQVFSVGYSKSIFEVKR